MKKIKILQMPVANSNGGITKYVLENLRFIDTEKFQFDFATFSDKLDFEEDIKKYNSKIHYITVKPSEDKVKFIEEMNKIFDENYDVLHLHTGWWKDFIIEEIAIERDVPKIIVHSHTTMVDIGDKTRREEAIRVHNECKQKFNTNLATDFIACSTEAGNWLFGDNIPKEDIKIFKNAIDTEKFAYNEEIRKRYRKELNIEKCFVLGHVGRFVYQKNHEFLIDTFYEVSKKIDNAKLILVGDGPIKNEIYKKVEEYNILDKVLFLGRRDDIANIMQAMDVFLLPSRFEGLPLVLIEAQCSGLNCIVSENISYESKVSDTIKYLPNDKKLWISKILESKDYNRKDNSKNIIDEGYSLVKQIKQVEKMYSK